MTNHDPVRSSRRPAAVEVPEVVAVDQPFDKESLHAMRSTLAAHAAALGIPEIKAEHLLIVASELATNAILHGGGSGKVRLWRRGGDLYCQVADDGPGTADPAAGTCRPDQAGDGGRGLWICRQLCARVDIAARPGRGTTVTAVLGLT